MSYNYKKKEVISINQLNYKAPEKSHVTEDLVGYNPYSGEAQSVCCCLCTPVRRRPNSLCKGSLQLNVINPNQNFT